MVAYMNQESFRRTLELGEAVYYSTSRQELWHKGQSSGNIQVVKEMLLDCDGDALLLKVEQRGGAACHTGRRSCFFRKREGDALEGRRGPGLRSEEGVRRMSGKSDKRLRLGLPKGSLQETTALLFEKAGYNIRFSGRSYYPEIDDPEIECVLIRAQEMARYVEQGVLDAGITGVDWVMETRAKVKELADLKAPWPNYRPVRWLLAVKDDSKLRKVTRSAGEADRHRGDRAHPAIPEEARRQGRDRVLLRRHRSEAPAARRRHRRRLRDGLEHPRQQPARPGYGAREHASTDRQSRGLRGSLEAAKARADAPDADGCDHGRRDVSG